MRSWAAIKLIVLDYFASIYTSIIPYRFSKFYYLDMFAGAGIGIVEDSKGDLILGSSLLIGAYRTFTHMFFCEDDVDLCSALEKRLLLVKHKDGFSVYPVDCNKVIAEILSQIKDGHSLIFIDPYGMDIGWDSFYQILTARADIILNFQTQENARGIIQPGGITLKSQRFFGEK